MLVLMGNYMPQLRPALFVGFRTPWALSDEGVWRKTHRLGGAVFVLAGVGLMAGGVFSNTVLQTISMGLLLAGTAAAWVYSYILYRKLDDKPHNLEKAEENENAEN